MSQNQQPQWWGDFTREIRANSSCMNTCLQIANRYFAQHPQDVQRMWRGAGIDNNQIAGINGQTGVQNSDTGAFLVAAAMMSNSGVALDTTTAERALTGARAVAASQTCNIAPSR